MLFIQRSLGIWALGAEDPLQIYNFASYLRNINFFNKMATQSFGVYKRFRYTVKKHNNNNIDHHLLLYLEPIFAMELFLF